MRISYVSIMKQLVEEFIERSLATFISSVEILSEGLQGGQTIDGIMNRIIHTLSCAPDRRGGRGHVVSTADREGEREGPGSCKIWE